MCDVWFVGARRIFLCIFYIYVYIYVVVAMSLGQIFITIILVHCVASCPLVTGLAGQLFEKKIQLDKGRPAVPAWPKSHATGGSSP